MFEEGICGTHRDGPVHDFFTIFSLARIIFCPSPLPFTIITHLQSNPALQDCKAE